jgi:hypothetical protein
MGSPPVFYQTGIVSSSLVPRFITCVLSDRNYFLFASTWFLPLCSMRQELFPLRYYLGSPPVCYQTGIVSSSLVPGFNPYVLWDRNCFLFASTWVHPLCFIGQELFPLHWYPGSPPVFHQTWIVSCSLVPGFTPCVLSDRNCFLFASTWVQPLCFMRQELFPLRYYLGSTPVCYQTGIVSSSLVPGFNPYVLWDRNCFLFASTWVHTPVFYETGIVSSSLVPGFTPCVLWDRNCFLFASTWVHHCVLSDRNCFLFTGTWVHPLCFIRHELFPVR